MASEAVAMLLPKGFVLNDTGIYDEVASYAVVPPEKITKFWGVYTTTFRRLVDPTASRLEYFWWHVWGSDRRHLSGPVLAKIFKDISDGPTFVPLRGPPNRYDPDNELEAQVAVPKSSATAVRPSGTGQEQQSSVDSFGQKEPTPSSSRPPPAHPILKKPRGPSTSGSRPTTRFILPPDADDASETEAPLRTAASDMPPPPPPPPRPTAERAAKKPSLTAGKRFVASTAASRRRPALPRRQSSQTSEPSHASATGRQPPAASHSQSSTGSSSQVEGVVGPSHAKRPTDKQGVPPCRPKKTSKASQKQPASNADAESGSEGNCTSEENQQSQQPTSSGMAFGRDLSPTTNDSITRTPLETRRGQELIPQTLETKQPATARTEASSEAQVPGRRPMHPGPPSTSSLTSRARPVTSQPLNFFPPDRPVGIQHSPSSLHAAKSPSDMLPYELRKGQSLAQRASRAVGTDLASDQSGSSITPSPHSSMDSSVRGGGSGLQPPQTVSSIVGTSWTTARGQFDSDSTPVLGLASMSGSPQNVLAESQRRPSVLGTQFTPTPPRPTPTVPFGRSKSQLKLVLEREKAKGHDIQPRSRSSGGPRANEEENNQ